MSGSASGSLARTTVVGAACAVVAVVASNAVWAVRDAAPTRSATGPAELPGSDVAPLVVPLTLVALACWGAVLVLRRRGRRVVAAIGAVAAGTAAVASVTGVLGADDLDPTAWPWVVAAAAVLSAAALLRAWVAAPGWPEMSSRYDRRAAQQGEGAAERPQGPADLWRALDEGRDPTV